MRVAALAFCVVLAMGSESAELRTWKDKTGRFSILAELVESDGTKVKLKNEDGQVIEVAIDRLSDPDRQYLESQVTNPFAGPAVTTPDLGASARASARGRALQMGPAPGCNMPGRRDKTTYTRSRSRWTWGTSHSK